MSASICLRDRLPKLRAAIEHATTPARLRGLYAERGS